jgi:hypothetical protein
MSHASRWEYFRAIYARYRRADRKSRQARLDEFCSVSGYHRKYALRLLKGPPPERRRRPVSRKRAPRDSAGLVSILAAVWAAAGYPGSVVLKALLPRWMPWVRKRFRLKPQMEEQLLSRSARQMDRRLRGRKARLQHRRYGGTKPGTLLKHPIPLKTDNGSVKMPGFTEIDWVAHGGNSAQGEFAHSLNVTDIHTPWTETRALLGKGHERALAALDEIRQAWPFRWCGIDSDNGSEFINWPLGRWGEEHQIFFRRGRPYKKDDNAHGEEKNRTPVRQLLGWDRYDTPEAVEAIHDLYRHELGWWLNLFRPSVKRLKKKRVGSQRRRVYGPAQTPLERVAQCEESDPERVAALKKLQSQIDPFELSQSIDRKLQRLYRLAHQRLSPTFSQRPGGKT